MIPAQHLIRTAVIFTLSIMLLLHSNLAPLFAEASVKNIQDQDQSQTFLGQNFVKIPQYFEPNQGQLNSQVKFLSRGRDYIFFLTRKEAVLCLMKPSLSVLRMKFEGANEESQILGEEKMEGISNYFTGQDSRKWHTNIPHFSKVRYQNIYPGIDLVFYSTLEGKLEYDFVVSQEADPAKIKILFTNLEKLELEKNGDLSLYIQKSRIQQTRPRIYQEIEGIKKEIEGQYILNGNNIGFKISSYDVSKALIIDPEIIYASYLGGLSEEQGGKIAVDKTGNLYLTGSTFSLNFPVAGSPVQPSLDGSADAFITKINADGTTLVYSTYLGGNLSDSVTGIAVDGSGSAYISGTTVSSHFPTTAGSLQPNYPGGSCTDDLMPVPCSDAFVTKLSPVGNALIYSTYYGSAGFDYGNDIAIDASANAYVAATSGMGIYSNVKVLKLNSSGNAALYQTTFGGSSLDSAYGIAVDSSGNAYLTGRTESANFPVTAGSLQGALSGTADAFIVKLNFIGSSVYSTYLGGTSSDRGHDIAVDTSGCAYVTGYTYSTNFPGTAASPIQPFKDAGSDAFVAKINASGTAVVYSTYLGGNNSDQGMGIALDSKGRAHVTGYTTSNNFIGTAGSAIQPVFGGGFNDAFAAKISKYGNALVYSTYLGGSSYDSGYGIATDYNNDVYIAGSTYSDGFPGTSVSPIQNTRSGNYDIFIIHLSRCGGLYISPTTIPNAALGYSYNRTLSAGGGESPYLFSLQSGNLPPGLTLNGQGKISGIPTSMGTYSFTVIVKDAEKCTFSQSYKMRVYPVIYTAPMTTKLAN